MILCANYDLRFFGEVLFPDYEVLSTREIEQLEPQDVLLAGLHGGCHLDDTFPGKVIYLNGEPHMGEMRTNNSCYLGPGIDKAGSLSACSLPLFYASVAILEIPNAFSALSKRPTNSGKKFLLYISSRCLQHRESAFDALSEVTTTTSGGRCHGSANNYNSIKVSGTWQDSQAAYSSFLFGLVMENTKTKGYVTEKILNAFIGGTVPIYYGSEDVFQIFNKDAFVYYNEGNTNETIAEVRHLLENKTAYQAKLSAPILASGALENYFWQGKQVEELREKIGLPLLQPQLHAT